MKGIIGAIAGDIIGSTHEFHPIKIKEFSLFNKRSTFTDDTIMTLAVAKWLLNDKRNCLGNCKTLETDILKEDMVECLTTG